MSMPFDVLWSRRARLLRTARRAPSSYGARSVGTASPSGGRARSVVTPRSVAVAVRAVAVAVALAAAGCGDPTRDATIEALGDEAAGVPVGPLHRPGQPCNVCHDGEIAREFAVAGTVYWAFDSKRPAPGTRVDLTDADGEHQVAYANCSGNFFLLPEELKVTFPFWVKVSGGGTEVTMDSPVNGDGSCASCHKKTLSTRSTGRVFLYENPPGPAPEDCQ